MKNLLVCLFLSCFLFSNQSFAHAEMNGGIQVVILDCKSAPITYLAIPEKYFDYSGVLIQPLQISLMKNGATISFQNKDLQINLPSSISGTHILNISIGDFTSTKKIVL